MVDAYDVLGLNLDASPEDIKKAYRKLSLQLHPDKVQASSPARRDGLTPEDRFNELKAAYDVLQDAERRAVYDTFGVDLGPTPPGQEVWSTGMLTLIVPMSSFTMKTFVAYCARWLASFFSVKLIVLICSIVASLLHARGVSPELGSFKVRKPVAALINLAATGGLLVLHCIWPVLFDTACFMYLVTEIVGVEVLGGSGQATGIVAFVCLVFAWLASRWWTWMLYLELALLGLALLSAGVAALVVRLFVEDAKERHSETVRAKRHALRKGRQELIDQTERLTRRLEASRVEALRLRKLQEQSQAEARQTANRK